MGKGRTVGTLFAVSIPIELLEAGVSTGLGLAQQRRCYVVRYYGVLSLARSLFGRSDLNVAQRHA